ncbi:cystathionine beta-lyase [Hyphomicrobium sp. MC1]|uniref:cystathionine beta-lyase n=1 Tax=Hyphomicrobium sp. (strain MC1) TaxID=717785 RepID=UPI000213D5CD|nr:cystathionine beta-lyase [Hyphomicrobium sp. MC1]CCB65645.1 cystathionine beta-lyase, PLP-dependent (beta-cystathionase) [Hyphomicrobium sp. MC1]
MTVKKEGSERGERPETDVVHLGRKPFEQHGFVNTPVYRGSTVLYPTLDALRAYSQPYTYGRRATPTTRALEEAITQLEGGAATILTSSGLGAISTAILAFAEAGDHVLILDSVYQPARTFADKMLTRLGVEVTYYDPLIGADIAKLFRPNTRLVMVEAPGSQTFEMQDIPAIAAAAHAKNIWVLADNTWATPLFCKPLALGADVSIQAATKYIVGHADAMLGTVTANARAAKFIDDAKERLGTCPGSEETYLGLRGLRTLAVRLQQHQRSGIAVAEWLAARPEVDRVLHPALPNDPGHAIWKRDFTGACGLFSIVLKPVPQKALAAFLDGLKLFGMGYSWGGYESLVVPFDPTSYRTATRWQGPGPALRFHIGLEAVEDLIADLAAGFERMKSA